MRETGASSVPVSGLSRRSILRGLAALPMAGLPACAPAPAELTSRHARLGITDPTTAPFFARADGRADDTRAVQGAIDAAIRDHRGGRVILPPGTYAVSDTLHIENVAGLRITGTSLGRTALGWRGPPDRPMIRLRDTRDCTFADFSISAHPDRPLMTGIQTENGPRDLLPPTQNQFENIVIDGTLPGGLRYGFRIARGEGGDRNNEFHEFVRCRVANYRIAYSIEHSQSHTNRFYSCSFAGNQSGEIGVQTLQGSFYWYSGGGGGNSVADFALGSPNVNISIINGNFENSARLLTAAGPTGAAWPITIQGVRFSANRLHADGIMIDVRNPGPLILANNKFGDSVEWPIPRVRLQSNVPGNAFVSLGNLWTGRNALSESPYSFEGAGMPSLNARIGGEVFRDGSVADPAVFPDGDPNPTVHAGDWFRTRNSRRTVLSGFRNGWPGKRITVLIDDADTVVAFGDGALLGNGGARWYPSPGDSLEAIYDGARWHGRISASS